MAAQRQWRGDHPDRHTPGDGHPARPQSGLEFGRRYRIAQQLEAADNGVLKGRSYTLFELAPLAGGGNEVAVYLPGVGPDGRCKFDMAVVQGEQIAIDPDIAVGSDGATGAGEPLSRSVKQHNLGETRPTPRPSSPPSALPAAAASPAQ